MPKSTLKPFSFDTVFSPDDGREDKVDLMIGQWLVGVEDNDEIEIFRNYLAGPPKGSEELAFKSAKDSPLYGRFFLRPETKGLNRRRLKVRTQALAHPQGKRLHNPPLFGGYVQFGRRKAMVRQFVDEEPLQQVGHFLHASLYLSLNLQRYIRHQAKGDVPDLKVKVADAKQRIGKQRDDRSSFGGEFAFDREDNWIPNSPAWAKFAGPQASRLHMQRYLEKVTAVFEKEVSRAARCVNGGNGAAVERRTQYHRLSQVEVAWELASDDPIGDVVKIGTAALTSRKWSRVRGYKFPFRGTGVQLNSPCFWIPLSEDTTLRIYAKTNRRVRFEVAQKHLGKQWGELLKAGGGSPGKSGEERSLDSVLMVLQALRERAAKRLNKLMAQLRKGRSENDVARPLIDLLAEIAAAMPEGLSVDDRARMIRTLLFLLGIQRGYRGRDQSGEFTAPLKALKKRGVIKWDRSRQFYVLAPEFTFAVDAFSEITGNAFLAMLGGSPNTRQFSRSGKHFIRDRSLSAK